MFFASGHSAGFAAKICKVYRWSPEYEAISESASDDARETSCSSTSIRTSFAYPTRSFCLPQRQSKPIQVQRKQEPTDRKTNWAKLSLLQWRVCRAGKSSQAAPTRSRPSRVKRFAQALYRTICSCSSDENNVIWCQKAMPRIAKLSCAKMCKAILPMQGAWFWRIWLWRVSAGRVAPFCTTGDCVQFVLFPRLGWRRCMQLLKVLWKWSKEV